MKNLDIIEDEYKTSFEDIVEKYKEKLRSSKDHEKSRKEFSKNLDNILKKRNKEFLKYIRKNKDKLLEMPERKVKVSKEMGVYKAYNLDFNPTFRERFLERWRRIHFRIYLSMRSLKYNIVPSGLKLLFFKVKLFFRSLFFDIGNLRRFIGRQINSFMSKHMNSVKKLVDSISKWIKVKYLVFEEWKKKRAEEKKKKKDEAIAKKAAEKAAAEKIEKEIDIESKKENEEPVESSESNDKKS